MVYFFVFAVNVVLFLHWNIRGIEKKMKKKILKSSNYEKSHFYWWHSGKLTFLQNKRLRKCNYMQKQDNQCWKYVKIYIIHISILNIYKYTADQNEKICNFRRKYESTDLQHLLKDQTSSKYVPNSINIKVPLMYNSKCRYCKFIICKVKYVEK